ncbi:hypothetical protein PMSM_10930 [Paenibacillus macquariensis subsp. macquariensis]|nr:hypothetical protein PMSM_10930 [Paenibacillus macquariensis subsp. macquariensis]
MEPILLILLGFPKQMINTKNSKRGTIKKYHEKNIGNLLSKVETIIRTSANTICCKGLSQLGDSPFGYDAHEGFEMLEPAVPNFIFSNKTLDNC